MAISITETNQTVEVDDVHQTIEVVLDPVEYETAVREVALASISAKSNALFVRERAFLLGPEFKANAVNYTAAATSGHVIGGDNAWVVDGDIVVWCGWGYGTRVGRLNDNGTITELFQANVGSSSTNHSVAIDRVNKKFYVNPYYAIASMQVFDYSGIVNGGAGSVVPGTVYTTSNSTMPFLGFGYPYIGGIYMCGDWIYLNRYNNAAAGTFVERWNPYTNTYEKIAVTNGGGTTSYNGTFTYDSVGDRLYQCSLSGGGGLWVITNPSSASPGAYRVDINVSSLLNAVNPWLGVYADGNEVTLIGYGGNYRCIKLDITTPLTGSSATPTVVWSGSENALHYALVGVHGFHVRHPEHPTISFRGDRNVATFGGWVDPDDGTIVATAASGSAPPTNHTFSNRVLRAEYNAWSWKKATSTGASPTTYWIACGYGGADGYYVRTYTEALGGPQLADPWSVTFGPFTLDSGGSVRAAILLYSGNKTPAGSTLTVEVSNDGSTWAPVSNGVRHDFTTDGSTVYLRFTGTGNGSASGYVKADNSPTLCLIGQRI